MRDAHAKPPLPLSWRLVILAIVVVQFLFAHGAPWRTMFQWDTAILWSYATIPALVLLALLLRRAARITTWLLHSLEIAALKFGITATVLVVLLVARFGGDPVATSAPTAAVPPTATTAAPALPTAAPAAIFEVDGHRFSPALAVVHAGEPIAVRSGDGALHSARLERRDGTTVANLAVFGSGDSTLVTSGDPDGAVAMTVRCTVHGERETGAQLLVLPR